MSLSCQCNNYKFEELNKFIDSLPDKKNSIIQILHYAQSLFGYLPKEVQVHISKKLDISIDKISYVVNFYSYFQTEQKGKYKISVCLGTMCFAKGGEKILNEFERQLNIKSGESTPDFMFSLEGVRCAGACGLAPVVVVNEKVYGHFNIDQVTRIINEYKLLENSC